jgi:hypothetical protein
MERDTAWLVVFAYLGSRPASVSTVQEPPLVQLEKVLSEPLLQDVQ